MPILHEKTSTRRSKIYNKANLSVANVTFGKYLFLVLADVREKFSHARKFVSLDVNLDSLEPTRITCVKRVVRKQ